MSCYRVSVPDLDDLGVCGQHQVQVVLEVEGFDGQAVVVVLYQQGAIGAQVIQKYLSL